RGEGERPPRLHKRATRSLSRLGLDRVEPGVMNDRDDLVVSVQQRESSANEPLITMVHLDEGARRRGSRLEQPDVAEPHGQKRRPALGGTISEQNDQPVKTRV